MTDRPSWAPPGIDISVPSVSRMYDYYLGGSHNFEVDREAARHGARVRARDCRKIIQANRAFMRRAVRFALGRGITQFLDIGSGIPTFGNVHEVAQRADPEAQRRLRRQRPGRRRPQPGRARRQRARRRSPPRDLRDPRSILDHPETRRMLDLDRPVALLLVAVLHFLSDDDDPHGVVATLRDALAPGSLLGGHPRHPHAARPLAGRRQARRRGGVYQRTRTPLIMRPRSRGGSLLRPVRDGRARRRPDAALAARHPAGRRRGPSRLTGFAGVGRKA